MSTYKRMSDVELKRLEHRLERTDAPGTRDDLTIPGVIVAQVMRKAAKTVAIALFSLVFITGCASAYTYDVRTCPAPLTASGCAQYLGSK